MTFALVLTSVAVAVELVAVVAALLRARRQPDGRRHPWVLFATGYALAALAGVGWIVGGPADGVQAAAGSPFNMPYVGAMVCLLAALYAVARLRVPGRHVEALIDGILLSLGPTVLAWEVAVQPALERGTSPAAAAYALTFLAISIVGTWLVGSLVRQGPRSGALWRLLAATVLVLVWSTVGVLAPDRPTGGTTFVDVTSGLGVLLASVLAFLAPLHPSAARLLEPVGARPPSLTGPRLALLWSSMGALPTGMLLHGTGSGDRVLYAVLGVAGVALLGIRVHDVLGQRDRAIRRAEDSQRDLHLRATTDPVTGLPNREVLETHLADALDQHRATGGRAAVLFMDLDDFKLVNDSFGHDAGDRVLRGVAARLVGVRHTAEVVARFGGDEFVVLVPSVASSDDAQAIAHRYLAATSGLEALGGMEVRVQPSIGVAVSTGWSTTPSSMIRDADAAMYAAKRSAGRVVLFNHDLRVAALDQLRIEQGLRRTIGADGLSLAFQPIVRLADGAVVAAEALVRWVDPEHGREDTATFVAVAERSGLIHPLGEWVLRAAAAQWQRWARQGRPLPLAVNVSARELVRADYVQDVLAVLAANEMPADQLTLELTERAAAETDALIDVLERLRAAGVRIAVDDFGTGYFSLRQLRALPVDVLKVDRTFVRDMAHDRAARAIVGACIEMAVGLGLDVVAEGVETAEQQELLTDLGCGRAQGFWFGHPGPPEAVIPASLSGQGPSGGSFVDS